MLPSIFDIFKIGIGPSSSHTVGPMIACYQFIDELRNLDFFTKTNEIKVYLYGSLALTGKGHATDKAVLLGLMGETPEGVPVAEIEEKLARVNEQKSLLLGGEKLIALNPETQVVFAKDQTLPEHPNGMKCFAFDKNGLLLHSQTYFSIGGGNVMDEKQILLRYQNTADNHTQQQPYPFANMKELMAQCHRHNLRIDQVIFANESPYQDEATTRKKLLNIWRVMQESIENGCASQEKVLPGGLGVQVRAPKLYECLKQREGRQALDPLQLVDWVSCFAIAVNEENARTHRVVTSPTNGSAGVIPAVIQYFLQFVLPPEAPLSLREEKIISLLTTAAAVGMLYKKNASVSAAEVGCQGEIGVSSSMAAAGLTAITGGSLEQIENAAEIAMEHHLGVTCDPIGGLVQVPCIERNSFGAIKAITASRLALLGDGKHLVSLDNVVETMRETGLDMQVKYKETAEGGLATVNRVDC